jgi:hypothetical protein
VPPRDPTARSHLARAAPRRFAGAVAAAAALAPLGVVLVSLFRSPDTTTSVRLAAAAFCLLAVARPDAALLATMALVGFGNILSHLAGLQPMRSTEVLIVASLLGCAVRAIRSDAPLRRAILDRLTVPVVLFAMAAVASTLVWMRVEQVQTGYASEYLHAFVRFLTRDYFINPGEFWLVVFMAVILEGLALYVVIGALCAADPTFFDRGLRMFALGGAALALMSLLRLAEILLRNPQAIEILRANYGGVRLSPQIPDYIAAGSYFSLCWLAAVGMTLAAVRHRALWAGLSVLLVAALYLTGSRSVIAAAFVGLVVLVGILVRQRAAVVGRVAIAAGVTLLAMVIAFPVIIGRDVAGDLARQSLGIRGELVRTGLRIIATRPIFGVGIDRFHLEAEHLASPELHALWPDRKNPHNDFLRFAAELGLVGLGLFLSLLGEAAVRMWKGLKVTRDMRLAALAGGLAAFLVTSQFSNPLMVREVSNAFWMALGLSVGPLAAWQAGRERPRARWRRWPIALGLGAVILIAVPFRAQRELGAADLNRISYGFYDWVIDADGTRSRWTGERATIFVDGRAQLVEISLSGILPYDAPQTVEILLDGRVANRVAVGRDWQRVRTLIPPGATSRRIDLVVSPTWVPADVLPGSQDRRTFGVKVGDVRIISTPERVH